MQFVTHTPLPRAEAPVSSFDFAGLAALRREVRTDAGPDAQADAQRQVARQFEALFIQMLLRQARATQAQTPGLFDSSALRMTRDLGDEQLAMSLANPGLGLADALVAQMRAAQGLAPATPPAGPVPASAGASPASGTEARDGRRLVADSISGLIRRLAGGDLAERVGHAIRGAPEHVRAFVERVSDAAQAVARDSGIPARLMLSQAALESGWGQREILRPDGSPSHNLFGIKAGRDWRGEVVNVLTTEYQDGAARKVIQPFRAYGSYTESFADYARLLGGNARYREVLDAPTAQDAARSVQQAGYATDPAYAEKLISIMGYFQAPDAGS